MVVRPAQMDTLRQSALVSFENEMVAHSKEFSPRLCEVLGDEQVRVVVRQALNRAEKYGFTKRGPLRLCVEMTFLFGGAFDNDPQYPWAAQILQSSDDQMLRAEQLYARILDYQDNVSGPNNVNPRNALEELSRSLEQPPMIPAQQEFVPFMLNHMNRLYPQKAAYVTEDGLRALIDEGSAEAQKYGMPPVRGEGLIVVLMYSFGHGCTADPLYPWITDTLRDERTVDAAGRAERLENKAVTWLSQVVARNRERAKP